MKKALLYCVLCLSSIVAPAVLEAAPVQAYSVTLNGRTAGNPSGQPLYDVNINAQHDLGRTLEPFVWGLAAGTPNNEGQSPPVDLAASAIFKVIGLTSSQLVLDITLQNLTAATSNGKPFQAAILSMGFGVSPNATSATLSQLNGQGEVNVFDTGSALNDRNQNYPGGFKNIDICAFTANGCNGGRIKDGLLNGQTDSFRLTIGGNFGTTPSVTLSDFGLKFQTDAGSYQLAAVPEPVSILGSGLAVGFGALMQRQMSRKRKPVTQ